MAVALDEYCYPYFNSIGCPATLIRYISIVPLACGLIFSFFFASNIRAYLHDPSPASKGSANYWIFAALQMALEIMIFDLPPSVVMGHKMVRVQFIHSFVATAPFMFLSRQFQFLFSLADSRISSRISVVMNVSNAVLALCIASSLVFLVSNVGSSYMKTINSTLTVTCIIYSFYSRVLFILLACVALVFNGGTAALFSSQFLKIMKWILLFISLFELLWASYIVAEGVRAFPPFLFIKYLMDQANYSGYYLLSDILCAFEVILEAFPIMFLSAGMLLISKTNKKEESSAEGGVLKKELVDDFKEESSEHAIQEMYR